MNKSSDGDLITKKNCYLSLLDKDLKIYAQLTISDRYLRILKPGYGYYFSSVVDFRESLLNSQTISILNKYLANGHFRNLWADRSEVNDALRKKNVPSKWNFIILEDWQSALLKQWQNILNDKVNDAFYDYVIVTDKPPEEVLLTYNSQLVTLKLLYAMMRERREKYK